MAANLRFCSLHVPLRTARRRGLRPWRSIHSNSAVLHVSDEVRQAVVNKAPVVALETTIYTHGFPYPDNLDLAAGLEALVRHNGGIPAHCAILDGIARVGLAGDEMQRLLEDSKARKVSRRDLSYVGGLGLTGAKINGGTTISGTMILAHLAGIKVFATGGLGGVHRGVEQTMDVSADLTELGRTPVAVVSAGCKGFLDIPRTLEYLETMGVPVATFADGRHGPVKFPAFWSRESGLPSPFTVQNERDAAAMIHAQFSLPLTSGMLFPNPVPVEHSIDPAEMSSIIEEALRLADAAGVTGAANTPFVLSAIKELSNGRSIPANRALIHANVIRGTRVAVELSKLERGLAPHGELDGRLPASSYVGQMIPPRGQPVSDDRRLADAVISTTATQLKEPSRVSTVNQVKVVVAGSIASDLSCDYAPIDKHGTTPRLDTSNAARISQSIGGVGHNVATAIHRAGGSVRLCSSVGDDVAAGALRDSLNHSGLENDLTVESHGRTAQYVAVNDCAKNLVLGMADMSILETISEATKSSIISGMLAAKPTWLVADANWTASFLASLLQAARSAGIRTAFEPVSIAKSGRLFSSSNSNLVFPRALVDIATPNKLELLSMYEAAEGSDLFSGSAWWKVIDALGISSAGARVELAMATSSALVDEGVPQRCIKLLPFIPCILTKLGADGVLVTQLLSDEDPRLSSSEYAPHIIARSRTHAEGVGGVYMRLFPPPRTLPPEEIVSVNGVGDTFLGVFMAALTKRDGVRSEDAIELGQRASLLTLQSSESVSPEIEKLRLALELL